MRFHVYASLAITANSIEEAIDKAADVIAQGGCSDYTIDQVCEDKEDEKK